MVGNNNCGALEANLPSLRVVTSLGVAVELERAFQQAESVPFHLLLCKKSHNTYYQTHQL